MTPSVEKKTKDFFRTCLMLIAVAVTISGCSSSSPLGSLASIGAPTPAKEPSSGSIAMPQAPASPQNSPAAVIAYAQELIEAGTNPFLNKTVPKTPEIVQAGPVETILPPLDPYEGMRLLGVVYNPSKPMALMAVADPSTPGATSSRMVKKGDTIATQGGNIKITNITRDRVDMAQSGMNKMVRSLFLPEIVGYRQAEAEAEAKALEQMISENLKPVSPAASGSGASGSEQQNSGTRGLLKELTDTRKLKPGESNKTNSGGGNGIVKLQEP